MIREFGLSIKFRWSGGGEKMKKRLVRGLVRAKNKKNWLSEASDEQKTRKIDFPRSRMSIKLKKWLSEASDEQKTEKMAFRGLGRTENKKK